MKYARLAGGALSLLRLPIKAAGADVFTNDPAILLAHGCKPVIYEDEPEISGGEYLVPEYSETADSITDGWRIEESDGATEDDYLSALRELGVDTDEEEDA